VWALTESGKPMPVDIEPDPRGNLILYRGHDLSMRCRVAGDGVKVGDRHRPHFATCPDADSWRQR
jgi:hypothetical protein